MKEHDPFADLEAKYRYLLQRYAYQRIPGMDAEDIMQELRLVLWNCQKRYTPESMRVGQIKPASFKTYLVRALKNKIQKLHRQYQAKKRGAVSISDEAGELYMKHIETFSLDAEEVDCVDHRDLLEEVECLAGLSRKTKAIASFALEGRVDKKDWAVLGVAEEELEKARAEIRASLTEGIGNQTRQWPD